MNQAITTCAACEGSIRSGLMILMGENHYGQIAHGDLHCVSGLYNPGRTGEYILCERCSTYEERMIDEKGTNDIPELLSTYSASVRR